MIFLVPTPDNITVVVNGQHHDIKDISVAINTDSLADVLGSTAHV